MFRGVGFRVQGSGVRDFQGLQSVGFRLWSKVCGLSVEGWTLKGLKG